MNHAKIVLVACISAFVAITTAFLGVAGTIIGSVLSSVLYNVLSEILEKPVTERKFSFNFEYEIAYVFPLVVIAFIQLLLLLAFFSQWGILPGTFLNAYLKIQGVVDNNLYRILGFALVVMGVYPFIIKPNIVKKSYGIVVGFVGLIFLARGFVDAHIFLTNLYDGIFRHFDFPIEVFAFAMLLIVIFLILNNASEAHKEFKSLKKTSVKGEDISGKIKRVSKNEPKAKITYDSLDDLELKEVPTKKFRVHDDFEDDYIPYSTRHKSGNRYNDGYSRDDYVVRKPEPPKRQYPKSKGNRPYGNSRPDIDFNRDHLPMPKKNPLKNSRGKKGKY